MQPACLTPEEAARVLGIGRTFVYQLLATGKLESFKLGAAAPRTHRRHRALDRRRARAAGR